jgi:calcineurin-like phosphoesterase family protein
MHFFTADEHYDHAKIIEYCHRPFATVEEMNETLIANHNRVVGKNDITVHAGDFGWFKKPVCALSTITRLNGNHIFIKGSHDLWLPDSSKFMWRKMIEGQFVVVCHYAMRTWERAHHGAWQLYGHSHGTLPPIGKQWDVGVDANNFTPVSFNQLKDILGLIPVLYGPEHDKPV